MPSPGRQCTVLRVVVLSCALALCALLGTPAVAQAAARPPSRPSVASYSNSAVRLTWGSVKNAAAYRVKYSTSSKYKHPSYVTTKTPTVEIGKLRASRTYYIKVRALTASGKALTKYGKTRKVRTRSTKSYPELSPSKVWTTDNRGDELTLNWTSQGTSNRYQVRWSTKKSMAKAKTRTVTGTTTLVDGLSRATPYYFTVQVLSTKNKAVSQRTSVRKFTTAKSISFGTPTGLSLTRVNPTDMTLSWSPVRKASKYQVAYTSSNWDDSNYLTSAATTARLAGLIADTKYAVRVRVLDAAGQPAGEFSATSTAATPAQEAGLRVASYNVMCHTCTSKSGTDSQPWTVRRDSVASTIKRADPDVVALQEAQQSLLSDTKVAQFNDLVDLLGSNWALTNANRYNCSNPNSNSCLDSSGAAVDSHFTDQGAADDVRIAYRTDRVKLLKNSDGTTRQGSFLLPAAPDDPDPGWVDPSPKRRYMAWAFLQQKATGDKFLMVDVHLEPRNDSDTSPDAGCGTSADPICGEIRQAQAEAVVTRIQKLNSDGLPVVVAGDFSSSRAETGGNLPYNALVTSGVGLVDPLNLTDNTLHPLYKASDSAPAETRINIAFNSVNQYETAARCYGCRVDGVFDASRLGLYNGAYNDYILSSARVRVSEFEQVVNVDANGDFVGVIPSDHNLLRATLWLP